MIVGVLRLLLLLPSNLSQDQGSMRHRLSPLKRVPTHRLPGRPGRERGDVVAAQRIRRFRIVAKSAKAAGRAVAQE